MTIKQTHQCHPFLLIILETDNITFQFSWSHLNHIRLRIPNIDRISDYLMQTVLQLTPINLLVCKTVAQVRL